MQPNPNRRAFLARGRLAELGRNGLLEARLVRAAPLRVESDLEPRRSVGRARVHLPEGTKPTVETTARAANVLTSLDGRVTLAAALDSAAERRETLRLCRELLELGALSFAER